MKAIFWHVSMSLRKLTLYGRLHSYSLLIFQPYLHIRGFLYIVLERADSVIVTVTGCWWGLTIVCKHLLRRRCVYKQLQLYLSSDSRLLGRSGLS